MRERNGEARLEAPLLKWLTKRRRIRDDTTIVRELRWFRRNVDLITLTASDIATAYELKIRSNRRAVQQASYNRLAFDRSYVVTASEPGEVNIDRARQAGVGIILVNGGSPRLILEGLATPTSDSLREKLRVAIRSEVGPDV